MNTLKKLTQGDNIYFFKLLKFLKPYAVVYTIAFTIACGFMFVLQLLLSLFSESLMESIILRDADILFAAGRRLAMFGGIFLVVWGAGMFLFMIYGEKAILDLCKKLFRALVKTGVEDATHTGESIAAMNTDVDTASKMLDEPLWQFGMSIVAIVGSAVVVFTVHWFIGLVALAVGALSFAVQLRFAKPIADIGKERLEANAEGVKEVSNMMAGGTAIRAYNMQDRAMGGFDGINAKLQSLDIKRGFISMWQGIFSNIEQWLSLIITFALGGWFVITGRLEFPQLMVIIGMSSALISSIGSISSQYAALQVPLVAAKRVFAILDKADSVSCTIQPPVDCFALGAMTDENPFDLKISNLNFTYAGSETPTLKDINLHIPENQMVALVGGSGSGKSTLLRAIIGMYEREELGLSLGGMAFEDCGIRNWRQNFAYVDQSCKLFDMTVKENIAMGIPDNVTLVTDEDITNAAKNAAAHDFIMELENGYDYPCGEKGESLSGGQKQRIAIARALARKAPVLVLDEVTSALDAEAEQQIMDTVQNLRGGRTIIYTTHNLENVQTADVIVVMEDGCIVEIGKHEELLAKGGVYVSLLTSM